jgi:hypothetical protein
VVEGKNPSTANFEQRRLSVSCSLTAASGTILQWREDIASCWWDSEGDWKKKIYSLEEGKNRGLITALKVMVTIPREFNMDHFKFHLILESGR